MRASVELSSDAEADRRLSRLMKLVLESVGGERGFFITMDAGALHIEAAGDVNERKMPPYQLPSIEVERHLSSQIVTYVLRTGHDLALDDARADARFASCSYIRQRQPRSILCLPLSKRGEALGAVYIENNLAPGIFGADRLNALKLLSQQVAVAVENARLSRYLKENDTTLQAALQSIVVLERIKSQLSKFVPQTLQRLIETNPGDPDLEMRNEDASVLFLDMAGYTRMSEQLDTEELNELIETYFSSYLDDIHDNGGDISEIAGDGLMILFRDPDPLAHARAAARTALLVRDKTAAINNERRNRWPPVVINIGINSGAVLIGASKIHSQMGTRWTFTANGYNTNLAARIGGSAVNGAILVSEETAQRLGGGFALCDAGDQTFKGISRSIKVFSIAEPEPV
jgi:class 3 adenylate cyclase